MMPLLSLEMGKQEDVSFLQYKKIVNLCYLCKTKSIVQLMDCGMQPICNRFLSHPTETEYLHPLKLSQCNHCGLVQLTHPVPAQEILPHYDWITYNEPEDHLDHLVETICNLNGIKKSSKICGISFKDDTTLKRLEKKGIQHTYRLDLKTDLKITEKKASIESIQHYLTPQVSKIIAKEHGLFDVLIVRHILEHAHNMTNFIYALRELIVPTGYIIFEVPDCTQTLINYDYTGLWEEHIVYFTPLTFKQTLIYHHLALTYFKLYPYSFENSLIAIVRSQEDLTPLNVPHTVLKRELNRARKYASEIVNYRNKIKKFLASYRKNHGKIALLGAGHLACKFINILELKDYIEFVVDDNPNKQGMFMPGSHLPIYTTTALIKKNIKLCLLSLNPLNEDKVIDKNKKFFESNGIFASIFPASKHALQI